MDSNNSEVETHSPTVIQWPKSRYLDVEAFTNPCRFDHCVTSQGERGHSELKAYLQNNRHTLLDLKDRWVVMSRVFRVNYQKDLALARDRVYHDLNAKRWPNLLNPKLNKQIVPEAMKLLVQQLHLMKDEVNQRPCSGSFERVNGIPCYHTLRTLRALKPMVGCEDFHPHWRTQATRHIQISSPDTDLLPFPHSTFST